MVGICSQIEQPFLLLISIKSSGSKRFKIWGEFVVIITWVCKFFNNSINLLSKDGCKYNSGSSKHNKENLFCKLIIVKNAKNLNVPSDIVWYRIFF